MKEYFEEYLKPYIGPIEKYGDWTSGYKCCSQFIVHRDYIRKYPKKMYQDMFDYMLDGKHKDSVKNHVFEWTLHLLYDNPYSIRGMTKEQFKSEMQRRIQKIQKAAQKEENVYIDDCKIIISYD